MDANNPPSPQSSFQEQSKLQASSSDTPLVVQKKLSITSIFIIVVLFLVAGSGGYFLGTQNHSGKKTLLVMPSPSSGAGENIQPEKASNLAEPTRLPCVPGKPVTTTVGDKKYITINEMGVTFPAPKNIRDITYCIERYPGEKGETVIARFSTKALAKRAEFCTAESGAIGIYTKLLKVNLLPDTTPDAHVTQTNKGLRSLTVADKAKDLPPQVKEFPEFYIHYTHPHAVCSDTLATQPLEMNTTNNLMRAVQNLQLSN